eukprot:TRINITY_DN46647_c0_g1_i8.p1 TRINITY_DN46647_c0_g1~~TRINITY_DN46647_c0_g1_i8.p1  ORF type:complete len:103 (+),score=2.28 TRINITY_DN46647_c0_g1_i8:193-501(+)
MRRAGWCRGRQNSSCLRRFCRLDAGHWTRTIVGDPLLRVMGVDLGMVLSGRAIGVCVGFSGASASAQGSATLRARAFCLWLRQIASGSTGMAGRKTTVAAMV